LKSVLSGQTRSASSPGSGESATNGCADEQFLLDTGVHFGEWLAPPSPVDQANSSLQRDATTAILLPLTFTQDTAPSWMTMIERGATTIWEMWDGVDENGKAHFSLNHFSLGSVISFMHTHIAGIRLGRESPAYRRFRVAPVPGGGLIWARARLDSPYGPIESAWRIAGEERFELQVTVPPGTAADIRLPDGRIEVAGPGRRQCSCDLRGTAHGKESAM
jgi:hypothetical protein